MRTVLLATLVALGAILAGAVVALVALPGVFDPRALVQPLEARAAAAGFRLSIAGDPEIRLLWHPALEIEGVSVVDGDGRTVASARSVVAELDPLALLGGVTTLGEVRVTGTALPLDAGTLARLAALPPTGADALVLEGGAFRTPDGPAIPIEMLRMVEGEAGGTVIEGRIGGGDGTRVDATLAPAGADGMRSTRLTLAADGAAPVTLSARLGRSNTGWLVETLRAETPALRLIGNGVVRTDGRWHASLGLRPSEGSLDGFAAGEAVDVIDILSRLGRVDLLIQADAIDWRGGTVRDLQLDLTADGGSARIVALVATLPGETSLSLSGSRAELGGPGAFAAGTGLADTADPAALLAWLGAPSPWAEDAAPAHMVVEADYRLEREALRLSSLTARLGAERSVAGMLALGRSEPGLTAELEFDRLDVDRLARPTWVAPLARMPFDVALEVKALRANGRALGSARLTAAGDGKRVMFEELSLPDLAGLAIHADGEIEGLPDEPQVRLALRAAGETGAVWSLAGIDAPPWAREDGGAELEATLEGPPGEAAVSGHGRYGDLPFSLSGHAGLTLDGPVYTLEALAEREEGRPIRLPLTLEGDAKRVEATIGETGHVGRVPLAGTIALGLESNPAPVEMALRSDVAPILAVLGSNVTATGRLEARFDGAAPPGDAALAERLEGSGTIAVRDGTIAGFDAAALDRAVANADGPTGLINLFARLGGRGTTRLHTVDIPVALSRGRIDITNARADAEGADMLTSGVVELRSRRVNLHTRLSLDSTVDAPPIALDIYGTWDDMRARVDFNALQRFLLRTGQ